MSASSRAAGGSAARIAAVARHNILLRVRDPAQAITFVLMPMVLMVVLRPLYEGAGPGGATQVVTGLWVMFSVFGMSTAASSILAERHWETWNRLRVTGASPAELLMGKSAPLLGVMLVQQVTLLVYGRVVIGLPAPRSIALATVAVVVWAATLLAVAAAIATLVRSLGDLSMICNVCAMAFSALGGALTSLSFLPGWAQVAAHASPGYWALAMMQSAMRGDAGGTFGGAAVLMVLAAAAGTLAARNLVRGSGRARPL